MLLFRRLVVARNVARPTTRRRLFPLPQVAWGTSSSTRLTTIAETRLLEEENKRTAAHLSELDITTLYQEVQQAATRAISCDNDRNPGPTGRYLYEWIQSGRLYQRTHVHDKSSMQVTLLDQHIDGTVLSMSTSVDETLLAFVSCKETTVQGHYVNVRNIATTTRQQQTIVLPVMEQPVEVEFGQKIILGNGIHIHTLFVVCRDRTGRPYRVLATDIDPDQIFSTSGQSTTANFREIFQSLDPAVFVNIHRTKGCRFVAINARTQSSNEVMLVSGVIAQNTLVVRSRQDNVQYHVDVGAAENDLFVLAEQPTTKNGNNGIAAELALFQSSIPLVGDSWGECISDIHTLASPSFVISDFDIFKQFIALYERSTLDGTNQIRVVNRYLLGDEIIVSIPEHHGDIATISPAGNMCYDSIELRFYVESTATPKKLLVYNMLSRELLSDAKGISETVAQNGPEYTQRRVLVSSKDGTLVPLSLVYRTDAASESKRNETLSVILIGYGAYGRPLDPAFDPGLVVLLNRGFAVAYAHTRGGGDLGRSWHIAGRALNKPRAIEDYVACAEALMTGTVLERPVQLTAKGFSACGVIVGAAVNKRPDLFHNVVLTNAFLDVLSTMENKFFPLTQHEWEEYGNPLEDDVARSAIAAYCPVQNVNNRISTNTNFLLISTLDDESVPYSNALRYVEALRREMVSDKNVFLHVEPSGGHHLAHNRVKVAAMEAAFILGNRK